MVISSSLARGRVLRFHSDAVDRNTLQIIEMEGVEAISKPYRFELALVSARTDLKSEDLFKEAAYLGIKQRVPLKGSDKLGVRTLRIWGILSSFEQMEKGLDWVVYRAVLVPRLWRLSLHFRTRVFLDMSVIDIAKELLAGAGLTAKEYEFKTGARDYPKREYVVQYRETDLDFLSRLLEHEGIFYSFRQEEEGEKVVFGDSDGAYEPILGESTIRYAPLSAGEGGQNMGARTWFDEEVLHEFSSRHDLVQERVLMRDYNYRKPSQKMDLSGDVSASGFGEAYYFGDHYKDEKEGEALAKIRAEEISCREKVLPGTSEVRSFRAGQTFTCTDHFNEAVTDKEYLLVEVRHKAEQALSLENRAAPLASYSNEFTSIPVTAVFRPERTTPKPTIPGTLNARIDATGSGEYAETDEEGRYKVKLPFDTAEREGGKASRYIRMAQPYAGEKMGMHFPLHKGAEVLLVHTMGDPDRPIIAAAIPNAETLGPISAENNTQCKIATGGGNEVVIEDAEGEERVLLSTPKLKTRFWIGKRPT